ncbi:MAG TPA: hypothetical protein VFN69_01755, partial [Rudaea sp.]|nr:hypothetical protein [Rudaea sp.]
MLVLAVLGDLSSRAAIASDLIFRNGFEPQFRGTTIAGMESGFNAAGTQHICLQPGGPVAGTDYP